MEKKEGRKEKKDRKRTKDGKKNKCRKKYQENKKARYEERMNTERGKPRKNIRNAIRDKGENREKESEK